MSICRTLESVRAYLHEGMLHSVNKNEVLPEEAITLGKGSQTQNSIYYMILPK